MCIDNEPAEEGRCTLPAKQLVVGHCCQMTEIPAPDDTAIHLFIDSLPCDELAGRHFFLALAKGK